MSKQAGRHPTLADVAQRAGVSKTAASLILNDRPDSRLSAEATARVRAAARELGYRPNPAARSLRLGTTRTIGLVSDEVTLTRHASAMIRGVLGAARDHDHTVLMAESSGDDDQLHDALQHMLDHRVDGIILGVMAARRMEVPSLPDGTRLVIANGITSAGHPGLLPDERTAGRAMVQLLLDAGHQRIGVVGVIPGTLDDPSISATIGERFAGIQEAFTAAGVEPMLIEVEAWEPEVGRAVTHRLMTEHPSPTAILAANDSVAFGVYQALGEMALGIPTDVSVASFDDEVLARYHRPGLTTAHLPYEEMGRRAVEMILDQRPPARELLSMPIMVRDSVGPPRTAGVQLEG